MKYALHIRFNGAKATLDALPPDQQQAIFAEYADIGRAPGVLDGNQLQPPATAVTVHIDDGRLERSNGPVTGAVDGYYLYDAPDLEAAIAFAARIPAVRMGGTVEIRPVHE